MSNVGVRVGFLLIVGAQALQHTIKLVNPSSRGSIVAGRGFLLAICPLLWCGISVVCQMLGCKNFGSISNVGVQEFRFYIKYRGAGRCFGFLLIVGAQALQHTIKLVIPSSRGGVVAGRGFLLPACKQSLCEPIEVSCSVHI